MPSRGKPNTFHPKSDGKTASKHMENNEKNMNENMETVVANEYTEVMFNEEGGEMASISEEEMEQFVDSVLGTEENT